MLIRKSTKSDIKVDVCSKCHPFYTGKQNLGAKKGQVEKFNKKFGVSVVYTEMVSDCGLIYRNKETYRYLEIDKDEHPVGIQLFGGTKETLLQALITLLFTLK